VNPVRCSEE